MTSSRRILIKLILSLFAIAGFTHTSSVTAVQPNQWTPDERVPGYLDDTFTPFLIADQDRTVHALTSQWIEGLRPRKAIIYRRWSLMGGWTKPVDILLPPTGNAEFLWAFLDSSGTLHMIFMNGEARNTAVYYSKSAVGNADQAPAWSVPTMVGERASGVNSAAIAGDKNGNLVIIYSGSLDGSGIYGVYSADSGQTWSVPSPIFLTKSSELSPFSLRFYEGPEGKIRAAWNVVTNLGIDEEVYFANYDISTGEWSEPVELDTRIDHQDYFGPSFPAIADNGKEIIVMYNSGNPFEGRPVRPGRPIQRVRISTDGGASWNDPIDPFPFHNGRSGEHSLTVDSGGLTHALFIQRIDQTNQRGEYSSIGGIWHSVFESGHWTNPDRFVTSYPAHDVRAVVSQGNVLLVVWREDPGAADPHGVWFTYAVLDSPELPVILRPTQVPDVVATASPATTSDSALITVPVTETPGFDLGDMPSRIPSGPANPLIIAIVPVLVLLVGVLIIYQVYRSRIN